MSRCDYVIRSMGLLAAGSFFAILFGPPVYHCALVERLFSYGAVDWLREIDWCYRYGNSSLEVFMPIYSIALVSILATLPAISWLKKLGRRPLWAALGAAPIATPLLLELGQGPAWLIFGLIPLTCPLTIVCLAALPNRDSVQASAVTQLILAVFVTFTGLVLYQSLLTYPFWLAAKT